MTQSIVISLRNAQPGRVVSARFGMDGGTIGRAPTNTLVLDDPERTVSRVHAQVVCRDGRYFIIDRGSNPTLYNGRVVGVGNEAPLTDGDRLMIGGFELAVQVLDDATPASATESFAQSVPPAAGAPLADDDPFADLDLPTGPQAPPPAAAAPASQAEPEDLLDPFADPLGPQPPPFAPQPGGQGALGDLSDLASPIGQGAPSIDSLFRTGNEPVGGDPLALSPLAEPLHQPNTATDADPLAALGAGAAPPAPAPRSDHLSIMQFGFVPPQALTSGPVSASTPAPASQLVPASAPAAPAATDLSVPVAMPRAAASACSASAPESPRASNDALLAAFLRGLERLDPAPRQLTPAFMERVGVLLRAATEGTLQLLLTRQQFKHELRAERTLIVAQDNNPLKFSPTVDVALAHLLGPDVRSFMPADKAMRDAFNDLRAHQFGIMVGMRAALAQIIARFAPDELEKKITAKSALDNFFAAPRKAKLWNQFVQLYVTIASEAEDDFDSLFGKAFVQAYEEQMARLKSGEHSGREAEK